MGKEGGEGSISGESREVRFSLGGFEGRGVGGMGLCGGVEIGARGVGKKGK